MEINKAAAVEPKGQKLTELREWLDSHGTTQEDLARVLGISGAQMSRYINGSRLMPVESAVKVALMTGIAVEKLTDGRAVRLMKLLGERVSSRSKKAS